MPEHRSGGLAAALEHRPLLDVQLEVRARAGQPGPRLMHAFELDSVARHHVFEALAVAVAQVAHLVHLERAGAGGRAEQAAPETGAFLVRPVDQAQPDRRPARLGLRAHGLERRECP